MLLNFTRNVEVKRIQLFKKSINTHYRLLDDDQNFEVTQNDIHSHILCNDNEYSIENITKFPGNEKHQIRDSESKKIKGEIIINGWGANPFWQDSPSTPNAQVLIDKSQYNFRNITAWQFINLFNRDRHKSYDFKLYNIKGHEFVDYKIVIEIPVFRRSDYFNIISLTGNADVNTSNSLLPLIGLFLIQKSFENQDKNYSG